MTNPFQSLVLVNPVNKLVSFCFGTNGCKGTRVFCTAPSSMYKQWQYGQVSAPASNASSSVKDGRCCLVARSMNWPDFMLFPPEVFPYLCSACPASNRSLAQWNGSGAEPRVASFTCSSLVLCWLNHSWGPKTYWNSRCNRVQKVEQVLWWLVGPWLGKDATPCVMIHGVTLQ